MGNIQERHFVNICGKFVSIVDYKLSHSSFERDINFVEK